MVLVAESYKGHIWARIEQVSAKSFVVRLATVYADGTWRDGIIERFDDYGRAAIRYAQLTAS